RLVELSVAVVHPTEWRLQLLAGGELGVSLLSLDLRAALRIDLRLLLRPRSEEPTEAREHQPTRTSLARARSVVKTERSRASSPSMSPRRRAAAPSSSAAGPGLLPFRPPASSATRRSSRFDSASSASARA